jgi:hypothetical protein
MKKSHPAFLGAGLAGLFVGALLTVLGLVDASESAQLAGGYGLMLMGAALYLVAGLGLRRALANRSSTLREANSVATMAPRTSAANQS